MQCHTAENVLGEVQDDLRKTVFTGQEQSDFLSDIYQAVKEYMDELQEIQRIQRVDVRYLLFLISNSIFS